MGRGASLKQGRRRLSGRVSCVQVQKEEHWESIGCPAAVGIDSRRSGSTRVSLSMRLRATGVGPVAGFLGTRSLARAGKIVGSLPFRPARARNGQSHARVLLQRHLSAMPLEGCILNIWFGVGTHKHAWKTPRPVATACQTWPCPPPPHLLQRGRQPFCGLVQRHSLPHASFRPPLVPNSCALESVHGLA
jgi:hypothetical protein